MGRAPPGEGQRGGSGHGGGSGSRLWPLPPLSGPRVATPRAAVWEDSFSVSAMLSCNSQTAQLARLKSEGLG